MVCMSRINRRDSGRISGFASKLPYWLLMVWLWVMLVGLVWFVEPMIVRDILIEGMYLPLFVLIFVSIAYSVALISGNVVRGLLWSTVIVGFLILRLKGMGHFVNALLFLGLVLVIEVYWKQKKKVD